MDDKMDNNTCVCVVVFGITNPGQEGHEGGTNVCASTCGLTDDRPL